MTILSKLVAKDLSAAPATGGVTIAAAKGVMVMASGGDSRVAVSMICPGGVISGSRGCVVLDHQLRVRVLRVLNGDSLRRCHVPTVFRRHGSQSQRGCHLSQFLAHGLAVI